MLLSKKRPAANRFSLSNAVRKETLSDETGRPLVIVNLCYPVLDGKTPFCVRFNEFYAAVANEFYAFASHDLVSLARKNPGRAPCGAVMRTRTETPDGSPFSVVLETSVFDGEKSLPSFRDERVWDETSGGFFKT